MTPEFVSFYTIASISFLTSTWVTVTIFRFGSFKAHTTKLLFSLHASLLLEGISVLPNVYSWNLGLCKTMAFLHFYSGLSNIVSVTLLVFYYRNIFFQNYRRIVSFLHNNAVYLVTIFPLITVLPFSTNAYNELNDNWCTLETNGEDSNIWAFSVFYGIVWPLLLVCTVVLTVTVVQVYRADRELGNKLLSTVGAYCIISVACWVPRTFDRIVHFTTNDSADDDHHFISYMPVYICGICYFLIFLYERNSLKAYEEHLGVNSLEERFSFSWEYEDDSKSIDNRRSSLLLTSLVRASENPILSKTINESRESKIDKLNEEKKEEKPLEL